MFQDIKELQFGTRAKASDPRDLELRVKRRLGEVRPEFARLQVYVVGPIVRVIGVVGSFHLRQVAIAAAKRVQGVVAIEDDIEVLMKK